MQTDEAVYDNAMGTVFIGILQPPAGDFMSDPRLPQLGSSGRSYRRGHRASCTIFCSEMYSPPCVTAELRRMKDRHLMPGFALDLAVVDGAAGLGTAPSRVSVKRRDNSDGASSPTC